MRAPGGAGDGGLTSTAVGSGSSEDDTVGGALGAALGGDGVLLHMTTITATAVAETRAAKQTHASASRVRVGRLEASRPTTCTLTSAAAAAAGKGSQGCGMASSRHGARKDDESARRDRDARLPTLEFSTARVVSDAKGKSGVATRSL